MHNNTNKHFQVINYEVRKKREEESFFLFPKGEENYFDPFIDKSIVDLEAEFIQQKVHNDNKSPFLCCQIGFVKTF